MNASAAIQRLIEVCRRQHKSLSTERTYALWLKDYCRFIARLDPALACHAEALSVKSPLEV